MINLIKQTCLVIALALSCPTWADPIENPDQATGLAEEWIKTSGIVGMKIKAVKSSNLLYIVDLHEANDKAIHANQLLIRKDDGFATLVFPAHQDTKASPEQRTGMEGLTGMASMSGTRHAKQLKGTSLRSAVIRNARDARQGVETWLKMNNLTLLRASKVTVIEGIYIVELLDNRDGVLVNEAIMRRIDGYTTLVKSVKLPDMSFPRIAKQK